MPVGNADERRGGKANPIARSNYKKASFTEAFFVIEKRQQMRSHEKVGPTTSESETEVSRSATPMSAGATKSIPLPAVHRQGSGLSDNQDFHYKLYINHLSNLIIPIFATELCAETSFLSNISFLFI